MASENVPAWAMKRARAIWPKRVGGIEEMFDRVLTVEDVARVIAEERAAIVAWLRTGEPAEVWHQAVGGTCYTTAADAIDRGDARVFMDRALASAHAAGEEKGRRESLHPTLIAMLDAQEAEERDRRAHPGRDYESLPSAELERVQVLLADAIARELDWADAGYPRLVTLPTTPATPNPLPATGGEPNAAEVDRG